MIRKNYFIGTLKVANIFTSHALQTQRKNTFFVLTWFCAQKDIELLRQWIGRFFFPSKSVYCFSFFFSSTSFSRRKMCWTRQRSGHRSTHMLTLCGLGVSQHSWLSPIPTMPRCCWAEEVRDYGFSWGAATPACTFPMPASKFSGKAGLHRDVFLHKSCKGMERYPSFMLCPEYFRNRAAGLTWLQIHCWKIRLLQVLLENLTTQCLIPVERRHPGAFS